MRPLCRTVLAAACAAPLLAHGGQYRGPWPFPVQPTPAGVLPSPATIGAPVAPSMPGPTTGSRPAIADDTSWQVWWEFNKEPFLQLRSAVHKGPTPAAPLSGSGADAGAADTSLAPSEDQKRRQIVPLLAQLLAREHHRDIVTACLVGLAKVGLDAPPDVDLQALYAAKLTRDDQEVRETAALAFGIDGRSVGFAPLAALLRDEAAGRKLVGDGGVPDRTRAFAAYGLGLLARSSSDRAVKQLAHDALAPLLADRRLQDRDIRVAVVQALGLLAPDPEQANEKRLLWQTLGELWQFFDADLGRGDELVQAHVPTAIGRLLGRGDGADHAAAKEKLLAAIAANTRRHASVQQSAAQALGMLALPQEQAAADAAVTAALLRYYRDGSDQQARRFAVMSLARIGGDANRAALLKLYGPARKAIEKPWVALALGVSAFAARQRGEIDLQVARQLVDELQSQSNDDLQAALALAVGLSGWPDAGPKLEQLLRKNENNETLAGYLCVALALLDHQPAVPTLNQIVQRSVRRPFLLLQAAVALGRLGDKSAVERLQQLMRDNDSAAALAALAQALGWIGDRRSVEALGRMATDDELTRLARSFVVAALGAVGDKAPLPWNSWLAIDVNYAAAVPTLTDGRAGVLDIL